MKLALYTITMFITSYYLFSYLSVDKQRAIRYSETVCTKALMETRIKSHNYEMSWELCERLSKDLIGMY